MENKRKTKNNKKVLSYLVTGLILVCVVLLVTEIVINTAGEIIASQSNEGYSVVREYDISGDFDKPEEEPVNTPVPSEPGIGY